MSKGPKKLYLVTLALTYCAEVEARSEEEARALAWQDAEREIRRGGEDQFEVDVDNTVVEVAEDVTDEYADLDEESQEQADVENELPDFHPGLPVVELTESGILSLDTQESVALGEVLTSSISDMEEVQEALRGHLTN